MTGFTPRPYRLYNKIQYYGWGTKNEKAIIPHLLGIEPEHDKPYAELWIGAHPKASSEIEIDGNRVTLDRVVKELPTESLGEFVCGKFGGRFPFLLKVLSAARALSIQAHPNKDQAVKLHAARPDLYVDDNHKPEIAIAIDSLDAIVGFRPVREVQSNVRSLPGLSSFVGRETVDDVSRASDDHDLAEHIKTLYSEIMTRSENVERLSDCIKDIENRLSQLTARTPEESEFLRQYESYGIDVGLLSLFFFNMVHLEPGQAIFTDAGVPHAYLKGNIVECMANSDNVVRAGLTNKFKDVGTLLEILKYDFQKCEILNSSRQKGDVTYKTKAEEFEVSHHVKVGGSYETWTTNRSPYVVLVLDGTVEVNWTEGGAEESIAFSKGDSFFVPAFLSEFRLKFRDNADFFSVTVPRGDNQHERKN